MLYATLFSALGDNAGIFRDALIAIAIFFGVIELIALFIGVRLTRSMTKSVSELYKATEHINRGELQPPHPIRTSDQMAALEQSFNSMTNSLANLIAEQKEKQRMESELAIAHEVQALLFPADLSGLPSLEVHGVCRPARTVSGDYYDFIPLARRPHDAGGGRHQRQRNFGRAADGDGARVRPRLLAGAGATLASLALGAGAPQSNAIALYAVATEIPSATVARRS